jgi:hypothetical protein
MRLQPLAAAVLLLALVACAPPDPFFQSTRLKPLSDSERTMACREIDLAIDRADTVRWVLRDFGAVLESSGLRSLNQAGNLIMFFPMMLFGVSPKSIMEHGSGHYALDAADARIRELLQLKRANGCAVRATLLPGMNDMALLAQLDTIQTKRDAGSADERGLLKERTRLLDGLRIVPPPAAGTRLPAPMRTE